MPRLPNSPVLLTVLLASVGFAVEPVGLSEDEFKLAQRDPLALADERVQAMKPELRLPAIAKDAGLKPKDLQQAVERAEGAGDVKARCEANLKEVLGVGLLSGRVARVELDASAAQAVAYVQWVQPRASRPGHRGSVRRRARSRGVPHRLHHHRLGASAGGSERTGYSRRRSARPVLAASTWTRSKTSPRRAT